MMTDTEEQDLRSLQITEPLRLGNLEEKALRIPINSPTLLWRSAAQTITLATGAAALSIRASVGVGKWGLNAGRKATSGFIGLNQTVLETLLRAAGRDVNAGTSVALRHAEAEMLVERWIASIHGTLSAANILASSGFYLAESALYWTSDSSLIGLNFLDSMFGSTETSRAVAAIVTLMKKEYYKPGADGRPSEISTLNLLTTVASFLFLQRIGRRKTEIEWRNSGGDCTIWDIVIDDRGFRADVLGSRRQGAVIATSQTVLQSPLHDEPENEFTAITNQVEDSLVAAPIALSSQDQTTMTDDEIRQRIMEQLPTGTRASITTDTVVLKTVKVDVHGAETTHIEAPRGMVLVSEHPNFDNSLEGQTIIFKTASKVQSVANVSKIEQSKAVAIEELDTDDSESTVRLTPLISVGQTPRSDVQMAISNYPDHLSEQTQPQEDRANPSGLPIGPIANQKRPRRAVPDPPATAPSRLQHDPDTQQTSVNNDNSRENERREKPAGHGFYKRALKSLSPSQSSTVMNKGNSGSTRGRSNSGTRFANSLAQTLRPLTSTNTTPRKPVFQMPTTQSSTPLMSPEPASPSECDATSGTYFTVHERRRESVYSEVDTYSVHSSDSRPPSPTMARSHLRASSSISKTQSSTEISMQPTEHSSREEGSRHHKRSRSLVPSLYSMGTKNNGEETLLLAPKTPVPRKSIFEDNKMLMALAKDGKVPGQFPNAHLILTLRRFGRFASAAYGEQFLKLFGVRENLEILGDDQRHLVAYHREHNAFAGYTGLPPETIIRSSFVDPEALKSVYSEGFMPIIHFVTIDLEAKAIVLTCRGTLGLEDLLTDMACDYVDLYWQGQPYKVHRGARDAARRLMDCAGGNDIMAVLKASLEEYPEFGLVLVGHSLGGAVAALIAIMLSEPSKDEADQSEATSFFTVTKPKLLPSKAHTDSSKESPPITLPPGRPIHVYAFGSPAVVSSALRVATRGLITTVVNANDVVPYLSLGTLHDFRAVASRLNQDISGAFNNIKQRAASRVIEALISYLSPQNARSGLASGPPPVSNLAGDGLGEDAWSWNELVEMRKVMTTEKLYPPGEIFTLESTRVFDRDPDETTTGGAEQARHYTPLGRPATRVQLKWVKDVEKRFSELRFGRTMFHEHSPHNYENNLSALERGVCEDA